MADILRVSSQHVNSATLVQARAQHLHCRRLWTAKHSAGMIMRRGVTCVAWHADDCLDRSLTCWLKECCSVCKLPTDEAHMLKCDTRGCNRYYHLYCLQPQLSAVPESDWFCPDCSTSADSKPELVIELE